MAMQLSYQTFPPSISKVLIVIYIMEAVQWKHQKV